MRDKIKRLKKLKTDSFWNELFSNSVWSFLGDSASSVFGLIVTILLIRYIGSDSYGVLVLGQTYSLILDVMINVQSWKGVIQFGQKALAHNEIGRLNSYVRLGTILDTITAIVCGVVALLLAPVVGSIFGWSSDLVFCAQLFSLAIFSHFSGTTIGVLRILNKFSLVALQKFIASVIKVAAIVALFVLNNGLTLKEAVIIYVVTDIIGNLLLVIFAYNEYRKRYGLIGIIKARRLSDSKSFISFTLWGTVSEIVDIPVNYIDVFIVSLLGDNLVAIFKVFKQIAGVFQKISSPIQQSILPQFSQLSAINNEKRGYEVVQKIHRVSFLVMLPIALVAGATSFFWLGWLYGADYAAQWYNLLLFLVVQSFALSYATIHPYFLSLGHSKKSAIYVFVSNVAYLVLAFALVNSLKISGIIIAFTVQMLIVIYLKKYYIEKEIYGKNRK